MLQTKTLLMTKLYDLNFHVSKYLMIGTKASFFVKVKISSWILDGYYTL